MAALYLDESWLSRGIVLVGGFPGLGSGVLYFHGLTSWGWACCRQSIRRWDGCGLEPWLTARPAAHAVFGGEKKSTRSSNAEAQGGSRLAKS